MSANSNLLDKLLDENNNWFGQIDSLSAVMMPDLPEPTFSFKSGHKQCADQADEPVICRLSNVNIASESQQQQQLTKQSVKRALFVEKEEIDHEANLKLVQKQLDQLITEDCERWNFDFKNNRPLNNVNSRYQWCAAESVLSKLDLNRSCTIEAKEESIKGSRPATSKTPQSAIRDNGKASDSISNNTAGKLSNSNSTNTSIATRSSSVKRKLMNIDDYFLPTKKRNTACLAKDPKAIDLLPVNKSVKTVKYSSELVGSSSRSIRLPTTSIKSAPMRKCKKSSKQPACRTQRTRQKKSKSLEKATKRQTTLKF